MRMPSEDSDSSVVLKISGFSEKKDYLCGDETPVDGHIGFGGARGDGRGLRRCAGTGCVH